MCVKLGDSFGVTLTLNPAALFSRVTPVASRGSPPESFPVEALRSQMSRAMGPPAAASPGARVSGRPRNDHGEKGAGRYIGL